MTELSRNLPSRPSRLLVAAGLVVTMLALAAVGFVADTLTQDDASWGYLALFVIACMGGAGALVITDPHLRTSGAITHRDEE